MAPQNIAEHSPVQVVAILSFVLSVHLLGLELAVEVERIGDASSEQMKPGEGQNFVVLGLGDRPEELNIC